jgi:hypothetical protein
MRDGRREKRKKSEGEGVMERMLSSGGTLSTPLLAIGEYEGVRRMAV